MAWLSREALNPAWRIWPNRPSMTELSMRLTGLAPMAGENHLLMQIAVVRNGLVGSALLFAQVLREKTLDRLIHRDIAFVA